MLTKTQLEELADILEDAELEFQAQSNLSEYRHEQVDYADKAERARTARILILDQLVELKDSKLAKERAKKFGEQLHKHAIEQMAKTEAYYNK